MDDYTQRKTMAMGKGMATGDFGVESFKETMMEGKEMGDSNGTILSESQRTVPVKMGGGKMMAQSNPDHGKHK